MKKMKKIGLIRYIDDLFGNGLSYLNYITHKIIKKPYFGSYLASMQGQNIRHKYMQELIYNEYKDCTEEIKLLEIGSWAGGSVLTWINILESMGKDYRIFCIDPWTDYIDNQGTLWTHLTMKQALKKNKIYKLFLHNIISSNKSERVSILRGTTEDIASLFRDNTFDIVFIDGNHSFEFVKTDLELTSKLVKQKGILCGDDLELQYEEIDQEQLLNNKYKDVIQDKKTLKNYHPGVTLAVNNFFKNKISSTEGFWYVKKEKEHFENININNTELSIPKHLKGGL